MTTLRDIPESWHLLNACTPRQEAVTNDNYAADLQRALSNELSDTNSAREFFQSTSSHRRVERDMQDDLHPARAWRRER